MKQNKSKQDIIINFITALAIIITVISVAVILGVTAVKNSYLHNEDISKKDENSKDVSMDIVSTEKKDNSSESYDNDTSKAITAAKENVDEAVYNIKQYGKLEKKECVPDDYFDTAVFLGDSRTVSLMKTGYIPIENTFAVNGISHIEYIDYIFTDSTTGKTGTIYDILSARKPEKIFIALGINGVAYTDHDTFLDTYDRLIKKIQSASPDSIIVIQSMLPVNEKTYTGSNKNLTNELIDYMNGELLDYATNHRLYFLDFSDELKGDDNNTKSEYDYGDGLHFNTYANDVIYDNMCRYGVYR